MTVTKAADNKMRKQSGADPTDPVANAFRRWGYLQSRLDPMGRIDAIVHADITDIERQATPDELEHWHALYCGTIGYDYMHMVHRDRVEWLQNAIESGPGPDLDERWILERLMETELFERFLHSRYVGSKRFSIDGVAGVVTLLDSVLATGADNGAQFLYLAMSHRGRLNIMKNIVRIPSEDIFAGMEDVDPRSVLGSGDVKYHLGAVGRYETRAGQGIEVHLATNPSHLEAVDAVVMGRTRARQERWGKGGRQRMLPVTLHGDAAFAGQGVVSETLNLSDLPAYTVGGTVQIVVNNLVGFTAEPNVLHSTIFAADAGKRGNVPIIHVNGDDPVALWNVGRMATEYRYKFQSDIIVDVVGFRRWGHSEVEDPTTTQPLLYKKIKDHPMLWEIYARRIGTDPETLETLKEEVMVRLSAEQERGRSFGKRPQFFTLPAFWGQYHGGLHDERVEVDTGVDIGRLTEVSQRLTHVPEGFNTHPKLVKLLDQRKEMVAGNRHVDWGMAEALSLGSLLWDGIGVRLTGQDSRRGTFNHRHAALFDVETGAEYLPLEHLHENQGRIEVVDSPLSEAAAMGFEYGYSREFPDGLVVWEAQFGDFANGAQVVIDQFLSAAEDKWKLLTGLVLLLPHGYEGQGPEHSSARIERFLQLAAQDNMQIVQPSTSGQYFHLLRRQVLRGWRKPLIVFTPKSQLRAEPSCSPIDDLTKDRFEEIMGDSEVENAKVVILCSGKVAHELRAERTKRDAMDRAIVTVEQFYPFPEKALSKELRRHGNAKKILWVQEEPANMGALSYMRARLKPIAGDRHITTIKRYESASPATGSAKAHVLEQRALIKLAFA